MSSTLENRKLKYFVRGAYFRFELDDDRPCTWFCSVMAGSAAEAQNLGLVEMRRRYGLPEGLPRVVEATPEVEIKF